MPVTKSAKKKLRQDKKRKEQNKKLEGLLKKLLKKAKKSPTEKIVREAISVADKAAKQNIIHQNKASRIKSKLSKLLPKKAKKEPRQTLKKSTARKAPTRK